MRNEVEYDSIGRPVMNKVLIQVTDIFDGFTTDGGIDLINATDIDSWADSDQFNITEFVIKYGVVKFIPYQITSGTMDYKTQLEIKPGDIVYWNTISFKEHRVIVHQGTKYLLVDYHDLLLRIRNNVMTPINGNVLLSPKPKETTVLKYTTVQNITERWEITHKSEVKNEELVERNEFFDIWEVGDIVHLLVGDKPFKVEGHIRKILNNDYFAVPLRMVLCAE